MKIDGASIGKIIVRCTFIHLSSPVPHQDIHSDVLLRWCSCLCASVIPPSVLSFSSETSVSSYPKDAVQHYRQLSKFLLTETQLSSPTPTNTFFQATSCKFCRIWDTALTCSPTFLPTDFPISNQQCQI